MSGGTACACEERLKPVRERNWIVYKRKHHRSAFAGYHHTYSQYSSLNCRSCHAVWRTKARYVALVPDGRLA